MRQYYNWFLLYNECNALLKLSGKHFAALSSRIAFLADKPDAANKRVEMALCLTRRRVYMNGSIATRRIIMSALYAKKLYIKLAVIYADRDSKHKSKLNSVAWQQDGDCVACTCLRKLWETYLDINSVRSWKVRKRNYSSPDRCRNGRGLDTAQSAVLLTWRLSLEHVRSNCETLCSEFSVSWLQIGCGVAEGCRLFVVTNSLRSQFWSCSRSEKRNRVKSWNCALNVVSCCRCLHP